MSFDLAFIAQLPRPANMSLEEMIVEAWVARTGVPPTEQQWAELAPLIEALPKKPRFNMRAGKFRG